MAKIHHGRRLVGIQLPVNWWQSVQLPNQGMKLFSNGLILPRIRHSRDRFERIVEASFGIHKCIDSMLESRVAPPIFLKRQQARFKAGFFWAPLPQIGLDRLVQQLIDRTPLEFTQVLQSCPLFLVDSQSEWNSRHISRLRRPEHDVNIAF
jgi:hypothetical protein